MFTFDTRQYSYPIDVSYFRTYTFLVLNNGNNPVTCQAELSPDGMTWGVFGDSETTVLPGGMQTIVPQCFLRFARLAFKNKNTGLNSMITVWFQGQS